MNSVPIIVIGIIIMIFGVIFQFQGQGMVGPEDSFIYEYPIWINNVNYIAMFGVIIILIGYLVE